MKITGIDYEDGECIGIDVTTDGEDKIHFIPVTNGANIRASITAEYLIALKDEYDEVNEQRNKLFEEIEEYRQILEA